MSRAVPIVLLVLLSAHASPVLGQRARGEGQTPQISTRELAVLYATGRYIAPVRCTREDGSLVELQEAITVREDPSSLGTSTGDFRMRATFFGIEVSGVKHCHNLMTPRLPDRRGVLQITFRGQTREDLGVSYFRRELDDGEVEYHVQAGRLRTREIGSEADPVTVEFDDDAQLIIRELEPRSDPARMLARFATQQGLQGVQPFELEISSDEQRSFKLWVVKDNLADASGHRAPGSRR